MFIEDMYGWNKCKVFVDCLKVFYVYVSVYVNMFLMDILVI